MYWFIYPVGLVKHYQEVKEGEKIVKISYKKFSEFMIAISGE